MNIDYNVIINIFNNVTNKGLLRKGRIQKILQGLDVPYRAQLVEFIRKELNKYNIKNKKEPIDMLDDTVPSGMFAEIMDIPEVVIPMNIRNIEPRAFSYSGIKSIKTTGAIPEISAGAFEDCPELESVELFDGVVKIESGAFSNCPKLKQIAIPDTVKEIEADAFDWDTLDPNIRIYYSPIFAKALAAGSINCHTADNAKALWPVKAGGHGAAKGGTITATTTATTSTATPAAATEEEQPQEVPAEEQPADEVQSEQEE